MTPGPINLQIPEMAYLYGFLLGDGHLSKERIGGKKGALSVELSARDRCLLEKLAKLLPCNSSITNRVRDTNFVKNYASSTWAICDLSTREAFIALGLPQGKKSYVVAPPSVPTSWADFWRGVIDADGSVGITKLNRPFVSLVTASDAMKEAFTSFTETFTGYRKRTNRNRRDGVYNIMVTTEAAQAMVGKLYYTGCLCLERKMIEAQAVLNWKRPQGSLKREHKRWTPDQDDLVLNHSIETVMKTTGRSQSSVYMRRRRLGNNT